MTIKKLKINLLTLFFGITAFSQTVNNITELNSAISSATAGTTITLANGTWNNIFISISGKNGSSSAPITITAETPGSVLMTGNSRVYMKGSYITVSGLVFQNPANLIADASEIEPVIELKECNNCKVINNKIDSYNGTEAQKTLKFKWLLLDGQYNEIAYNSFIGKYGIGSIINDNRNTSEADYLKIHHNYFADRTPINGFNENNDQDAIRIGNSATSLADSSTEVYENYFYNFFGEIEVISNKSGNNKYYNNTFRDYGGSLTLRHGDNCEVYGNFFFAENNTNTAGVRVIGEGHKIYNNYIEGINSLKESGSGSGATGGINVSNGKVNTLINEYYQVKNATIINNTFVNCDYALRIGTTVKSDLTLAPENLIIANNIMLNSSTSALEEETAPIGTSIYEGNITQNGPWDLTNGVNNNNTVTMDLLTSGVNFYELTSLSAAIDAGIGTYAFLDKDILDGGRGASFDAGAEEFNASGTRLPYLNTDVGVTIGFGAAIVSEPTLTATTNTINFSEEAGNTTFTIISNVAWEITENMSWLNLSATSGSGVTEITATVTENTSGAERIGTISINELSGGNNLSASIAVTQADGSFIPGNAVEITVANVTGVGTQVNTDGSITNGPENTIDNLTDTRWSADSTNGAAYLTFDLACVRTLTDVSIYFHKSTVRTTKISIATSPDGTNYTNVFTEVSSTLLTTEAYEDFDLNLTEARYVRIYGFGNSEGSGWNSIEEVKFYGNADCSDNSLSTVDETLQSKGITIFPIPVTNNQLTITSKDLGINKIVIYNTIGQQVLKTDAKNSATKSIGTSNLVPGVYYLVLEGIGSSKFIIK